MRVKSNALRDWSALWTFVHGELREREYRSSSIAFYRYALRAFYRFVRRTPNHVSSEEVYRYFIDLARKKRSWSWHAGSISVIRTVFDNLLGFNITAGIRLAAGANIRQVQYSLGHARLETTLVYLRCTPPETPDLVDRVRHAAASRPLQQAAETAPPAESPPQFVRRVLPPADPQRKSVLH